MSNVLVMGIDSPTFPPEVAEGLQRAGCDAVRLVDAEAGEADLLREIAGADALMVGRGRVDAALLNAGTGLKIIARIGQGASGIDLDAARERGVAVTHAPGTEDASRAELAFGLLLCMVREIPRLDAVTRQGVWMRTVFHELPGRTLGLIGCGPGAREMAIIARGFGLRLLVCGTEKDCLSLDGLDRVSRKDVLRDSHYLSVHLPDVPANWHTVGREAFTSARKGAMLVNVSGPFLMDFDAAQDALASGRLAGLACCVDPSLVGHPLFQHERCIGYPYDGPMTRESFRAAALSAARNVAAALTGGSVENRLA